MDSTAYFFASRRFASVDCYAGSDVNQGEPSHDVRRQAERFYRLCRLRLRRRHRAWYDLAAVELLPHFWIAPGGLRPPGVIASEPAMRRAYDGGRGDICEVISLSGLATLRVQSLPEQKKRPSAQASTRSVFVAFNVIIA